MNQCKHSQENLRPYENLNVGHLPQEIHGMDSDADSEREEESRPIKGQKMVYMPSKEEWDNHMRSHIPFRK